MPAAIKQRTRSGRQDELRVEAPEPVAGECPEQKQQHARLHDAMNRLSLAHRTVLALFAVDGMSHREIAATLGVPEGTVWSRLHLAKKQLAAALQ